MNQMGLKVNESQLIDSLLYSYNTSSNRLNYVADKVNDTTAHLGDFTKITSGLTQDYWYDGNGNLTKDNNKNIANIHYNYLNLPDSITVTGKGTIKYVYRSSGTKLQKITTDNTSSPTKTTRTDYAGPFIYQNDTLQYVGTEEGRARPKRANYSDTMYYDYLEKDHLGNTRVVLTDEKQYDVYPAATLEKTANVIPLEQSYYAINLADTISTSRIASWGSTAGKYYPNNNGNPPYNNNPYLNTTDTSRVVYRLNGATGDKTGLGITLKVMAGDAVNILGKSFWHNSGTVNNGYPISTLLTSFVSAFSGTGGVVAAGKGSSTTIASAINNSSADVGSLKYLLDTAKASTGSVPRAYINWILFDEQFNPLKTGSSFDAVSPTADNIKSHSISVNIPTGGYLYVYCSNESNFDVFFDNLQVIDTRGPLLETDNYYPFGLAMAGISSQAAGKLENLHKFNKGSELQHKEFSDGSGLEWYATNLRSLDPQIGRWWQIDPKANGGESPYASMSNNPIKFNDPLGDTINDAQIKSDKNWSKAYNTYLKSKAGQRFLKLYSPGGKYGTTTVTFKVGKTGENDAQTNVFSVSRKDGGETKLETNKSYDGIDKVAEGKEKNNYLKIDITVREGENLSTPLREVEGAESILHETQHARIDQATLITDNAMRDASYQHRDWMKPANSDWYKERAEFYQENKQMWQADYDRQKAPGKVKNEDEYIKSEVNGFFN